MMGVLQEILKTAGWGILISLVGVAIWLSPIGTFIDEFEEFRKWKRNGKK
jgi:hypothetical protein